MRRSSPIALSVAGLILSSIHVYGQSSSATRPRTVTQVAKQTTQTPKLPEPGRSSPVVPAASPKLPEPGTTSPVVPAASSSVYEADKRTILPIQLTPPVIQTRISEAQRLLKSRPLVTAMTTPSIEFVTVAALDQATARTHLITLSKETFLTKGAELATTTSLGIPVTLRVLRANGVNTALMITTADGKELAPLTVEYPIERKGLFLETAYYTSAHPALLSKDLVMSGQMYVRNMMDLAVKRLKERGVAISPDIINVAERLCMVEHIDHDRFRAENRLALYEEIYSLYALNQMNTYRYSVSVAGAGGMVQMIPWAYNLERQRHPGVGLIPDFVTAMRNHANALQAMLLYMQDTWSELSANDDVKYALNAKLATTSELLAAGYNSNAAKLPGYIRRGGEDWKTLIPRETQMYLQIYKSFESLIPMKQRTATSMLAEN